MQSVAAVHCGVVINKISSEAVTKWHHANCAKGGAKSQKCWSRNKAIAMRQPQSRESCFDFHTIEVRFVRRGLLVISSVARLRVIVYDVM